MESSNSKDPVCEVCKKKFKNSDNLSLHMRFHSLFGNFKKANSSESVLEEGNEGKILENCFWHWHAAPFNVPARNITYAIFFFLSLFWIWLSSWKVSQLLLYHCVQNGPPVFLHLRHCSAFCKVDFLTSHSWNCSKISGHLYNVTIENTLKMAFS